MQSDFTLYGCTVLGVRSGVSKNGNNYTTLRFLHNISVFDIFQFGDSAAMAAGLTEGGTYDLSFRCEARRDGTPVLTLVQFAKC